MKNVQRCAGCFGWIFLGHQNSVWIGHTWHHNVCAPWSEVPCPLFPLLREAWELLGAMPPTDHDRDELLWLIEWLQREAGRWPDAKPWRVLQTAAEVTRLLELWWWKHGASGGAHRKTRHSTVSSTKVPAPWLAAKP